MSDKTWEEAVKTELFPKVEASSVFMTLWPTGEPDVKLCVELGACFMYDKPLIIVAPPGAKIPTGLKRIADVVLEDCDVYTDAGKARIEQALMERRPEAPRMRVAVVGSRDFPDESLVRYAVRLMAEDAALAPLTIVSGAARGVDSWAASEARTLGLAVEELPADWKALGKRAGFERNKEIVMKADSVLAFWSGDSKGTKHTMDLARLAEKRVVVVFA